MKETILQENRAGVLPTTNTPLDPRQEKYTELYFTAGSESFGNSYQSAIRAGYSIETARNLTHNRPKWLSEKLGQIQVMDPELLLLKLTTIINSERSATRDKLKAIDMMMKYYQMFGAKSQLSVRVNIQSVLD